jgi:hypothetical protein
MHTRRLTRALAALIGVLALGLAMPAHAASSPPAAASAAVSAFQQEMTTALNGYLATYGDRLSPGEQAEVTRLITRVDGQLAALHARTETTARLAATHAPAAKQRAAARRAAQAYDAAHAQAMADLERMLPILQPKLSLFEGLRAKRDVDRVLGDFEDLGTRIHAVADRSS